MSFKSKLKRAFKKAHKIFIFSVCFIIIFSSILCVSAEKTNSDINITVSKVQIRYLDNNGTELTPFQNCYPVDMFSPYGGIFQGCKRDDNDYIADAMQWNMNIYFNQIVFEKGKEYTIKGYFALPWSKLITDDYWNVYSLDISLCDSNRNIRYRVDTSKANQASSWKKGLVTNVNTAEFGFLPFEFTFVPGDTFKGWFFNCFLTYNLLYPPNGGGYFGFSDLLYSYESDPLTDPSYSGFGPDSEFDDYQDFENSMGSAAESGIEDTNAALDLSGDGFADLFSGLLVWAKFIDHSLNKMLWYDILLRFGLALGLFSFILGLGNSVLGFVRDRDARQAREAREARRLYGWRRRGGG